MKLTTADNNRLEKCLNDTFKLNERMNRTLVGIIDQQVIRTDNDQNRSTIMAIVFDEDFERYEERKVSALAVFDKHVSVLLNGDIDLSNLTDEEILEQDCWYSVGGGYLCVNATLYNICENIREYI
jgi:hypothetical protein